MLVFFLDQEKNRGDNLKRSSRFVRKSDTTCSQSPHCRLLAVLPSSCQTSSLLRGYPTSRWQNRLPVFLPRSVCTCSWLHQPPCQLQTSHCSHLEQLAAHLHSRSCCSSSIVIFHKS